MKKLIVLTAAAGLAAAAYASDQGGSAVDQWLEEGTHTTPVDFGGRADAGDMLGTANLTRGAGPLNLISGSQYSSNNSGNASWDLYCIDIVDSGSFSATLGGFTEGDPESWMALFDTNGDAITFSNDEANGSPLSSTNVPGNGLYYLAVGGNGVIGANSLGEDLFPWGNAPGEYTPSATAGNTLAGYNPAVGFLRFAGNRAYEVTLTGAGYHQLPAPLSVSAIAIAGLFGARRRR